MKLITVWEMLIDYIDSVVEHTLEYWYVTIPLGMFFAWLMINYFPICKDADK